MREIKQKFDEALMWVDGEGDGNVTIQIRLLSDDGESNAVICLDDEQRKDLIRMLQEMDIK